MMICHFEMIKSLISSGFYYFNLFIQNLEYLTYCRVSECTPELKDVPQVVSYQKQVGDFEAIFVRKHPLASGICFNKTITHSISTCSCQVILLKM